MKQWVLFSSHAMLLYSIKEPFSLLQSPVNLLLTGDSLNGWLIGWFTKFKYDEKTMMLLR